MERPDKAKEALIALVSQSDRSTLFRWMTEHHDDLLAAASGERIRWKPFAEAAGTMGLTDVTGARPSPALCRQTWYRVRRLVACRKESARPHGPIKAATFPMATTSDAQPRLAQTTVIPDIAAEPAHLIGTATHPPQAEIPALFPISGRASGDDVATLHPSETAEPAGPALPAPTLQSVGVAACPGTIAPQQTTGQRLATIEGSEPTKPGTTEPKWTPEQILMINKEIAKALGELDHIDRFHRL